MLNTIFSKHRPVLIVDDCQVFTSATKSMLIKLGLSAEQIHIANNAKDAIYRCEQYDYQLTLIDFNLSDETDGRQLLIHLSDKKLVPSDCVSIVVTADNSAKIVRSFLELDPDGYLVKPLSYDVLKKRLPPLVARKQALSKSKELLYEGNFTSVINETELVRENANEVLVQSMLVQAKALIGMGRLDTARNVLVSILKIADSPKVAIELSRIYQKQNQFKLALSVLDDYQQHPIYSALIFQRQSEIYFSQQKFEIALEKIEQSIRISPENSDRQLYKSYCSLASFNFEQAIEGAEGALRYKSIHEDDLLCTMQRYCQLLADYTFFEGHSVCKVVSTKIRLQYTRWRKLFTKERYKPFELVLLARMNAMLGKHSKARTIYNQFMQEYNGCDLDMFAKLELTKLHVLLGMQEEYEKHMMEVISELNSQPATAASTATIIYLAKWRYQLDRNVELTKKLMNDAKVKVSTGRTDEALAHLLLALDKNRGNTEVQKLLVFCLTKVWPTGWSKHDVKHLALSCIDSLRGTSVFQSHSFIQYCRTISEQVDFDLLNPTLATV